MNTRLTRRQATKTPVSGVAPCGTGHTSDKFTGSGVVRYYVHGPLKQTTHESFNSRNLIQIMETGLPMAELTELQASLDLTAEKLAPMLGISKATFHRRKGAGGRLKPAVSDRVVRFARLLGEAVRIFGNLEDAKRWLTSPQFGLGEAVPLDYAKTELGAREVENLLGRIEYGVYS